MLNIKVTKMPRIDPSQLLQTLSVLLAPNGGIKSSGEVSEHLYENDFLEPIIFAGPQNCPVDAKVF